MCDVRCSLSGLDGLQFVCLSPSQCVMRLLVFGKGQKYWARGGVADRVLTSRVLSLESLKNL